MNYPDIESYASKVDSDYQICEEMSKPILDSYCGDLDKLVYDFNANAVIKEADNSQLERFLFTFGVEIYNLGSKLESVGLKEDISKVLYKEAYNTAYLDAKGLVGDKNKPTVAELTSIAEQATKNEIIVNTIYDRVYSEMKTKLNSAVEIVASIRKIISRRMQEFDFSNMLHELNSDPFKQSMVAASTRDDSKGQPPVGRRQYSEVDY